jgi:A/G-specific adenine glycosylase
VIEALADRLLRWYGERGRDLPWRGTRDPYRVLVSEVMLQQTQAARVVPYYERFLAAFPDERALAAASPAAVLAAWSGLGYNRRALALQRAAQVVVDDGWPREAAGLRRLPGVGPYTAAAVAAFAFDAQVAAVDTNARRVIERVDRRRRSPAALGRRAAALLPPGRAAAFNHAIMDLGAMVCTARVPRCAACPLAATCRSRGRVRAPSRSRRAARRVRFEDTERYVRGRVLAALVQGTSPRVPGIAEARLRRALEGLERDGLIVREGAAIKLPGGVAVPLR